MSLVLVVDDFPEMRSFLSLIVRRAGHVCVEAGDGAEALELASARHPALIISDVMMPTMDGCEFVRRLRANPALASTPLIICSAAYHRTEVGNLLAGLGVHRFLSKPVDGRELRVAMLEAIGGQASEAPGDAAAPRGHLEFLAPAPEAAPAPLLASSRRLLDIIALGEELALAQGPERLLDTVCRRARDLIGARAAVVGIADGLRWRHHAAAGWAPEVTARARERVPPAGAVRDLLDGRPVVRLSGTLDPERDLGLPESVPCKSFLGVRLSSPAYPCGFVALLDAFAPEGFSADDQELAALLASHGSMAYEKTMLLVEAQARARSLAAEVSARRAAEARLQGLSQRLVQVQEEERRNLARELHDEIGQLLTGFKLKLEAALPQAPPAVAQTLTGVLSDVRDLIGRARDLSQDLRPSVLDDLGLGAALLWHLERYSRDTGIEVAFEQQGLERRLPGDLELAGYRIVQEALTNVARHAQAREASVRVAVDQHALTVRVADRGVGFDSETTPASPTSSGLVGMSERAAALGGRLRVLAAPGSGTLVTAELPLGPHTWPRTGGER